MKIIFLDFDGVLNHAAHFVQERADRVMADRLTDSESFDTIAIERLNQICEKTGAKVVISSSWRVMFEAEDMCQILKRHGFRGGVIGTTPRLHRTSDGEVRTRGDEIQLWLDAADVAIESFVILDDSADMAHLSHKLVQTDFEVGLDEIHVALSIAVLGTKSN